jgi:hypothetical protein
LAFSAGNVANPALVLTAVLGLVAIGAIVSEHAGAGGLARQHKNHNS